MRHPAQIISTAQESLVEIESIDGLLPSVSSEEIRDRTIVRVETVLSLARQDFETYFSHRPATHLPSPLEADPKKTQMEIERLLYGILLGVMSRGAVFEALEKALLGDSLDVSDLVVDYTTPYVDEYPDYEGEHQFMTALVRRLDDGLAAYYKRPHTLAYRKMLQKVATDVREAERAFGKPLPPKLLRDSESSPIERAEFDVWTVDSELLFSQDIRNVKDNVRQTLRHNAETAMLSVRIFPECVLSGFEDAGIDPPELKLEELQQLHLQALPILMIKGSVRQKNGIPEDPQFRQQGVGLLGDLIVEVDQGGVRNFRWANRKFSRMHTAGRCPANSSLSGLSKQQTKTIEMIRSSDTQRPNESKSFMSTIEALLRLATVVAPEMWAHQFAAHRLCIDINDVIPTH